MKWQKFFTTNDKQYTALTRRTQQKLFMENKDSDECEQTEM